jgi:cell shape-determining protein MreC
MSGVGDRKIVFALLGIGILCLIGLGGSLYHGKAAQLKELERTLAQKEAELEEVQAKVVQLPELEQQHQDLRERRSCARSRTSRPGLATRSCSSDPSPR